MHQLSQLLGTYAFYDRVTFKNDSDGALKHDGDDITIMTLALIKVPGILSDDTGIFVYSLHLQAEILDPLEFSHCNFCN